MTRLTEEQIRYYREVLIDGSHGRKVIQQLCDMALLAIAPTALPPEPEIDLPFEPDAFMRVNDFILYNDKSISRVQLSQVLDYADALRKCAIAAESAVQAARERVRELEHLLWFARDHLQRTDPKGDYPAIDKAIAALAETKA